MKRPKLEMVSEPGLMGKREPVFPDYSEIMAHFSAIRSKTEVIHGFLSYGRRFFENVAFFIVTRRSVTFLGGEGPNILPAVAIPPEIAIDRVCLVRRSIVNEMKYNGPVPLGTDDSDVFLQFLRGLPDEASLYPGRVSQDVDTLFYAESPRGILDVSAAGLDFVIEKTILALRMLYVKQQLKILPDPAV